MNGVDKGLDTMLQALGGYAQYAEGKKQKEAQTRRQQALDAQKMAMAGVPAKEIQDYMTGISLQPGDKAGYFRAAGIKDEGPEALKLMEVSDRDYSELSNALQKPALNTLAKQYGLDRELKNRLLGARLGSSDLDRQYKMAQIKNMQRGFELPNLTPSERASDIEWAKTYRKFMSRKPTILSNIRKLEQSLESLRENPNLTGGVDKALLPEMIIKAYNPKAVATAQKVKKVLYQSLKDTFGSQLSDSERTAAVETAWDYGLEVGDNIDKVKGMIEDIKAGIKQKQEEGRYFKEYKTLRGYSPTFNINERVQKKERPEIPEGSRARIPGRNPSSELYESDEDVMRNVEQMIIKAQERKRPRVVEPDRNPYDETFTETPQGGTIQFAPIGDEIYNQPQRQAPPKPRNRLDEIDYSERPPEEINLKELESQVNELVNREYEAERLKAKPSEIGQELTSPGAAPEELKFAPLEGKRPANKSPKKSRKAKRSKKPVFDVGKMNAKEKQDLQERIRQELLLRGVK